MAFRLHVEALSADELYTMAGTTIDTGLLGIQSGLQQAAVASDDVLEAFESGNIEHVAAAVVELSQAQAQIAASAEVVKSDQELSRYMLDLVA